MEHLSEERANRAARHDDRPFRAERPARAYGDGRRERLQDRNLRGHAAAPEENRFERFGYAVAANLLRPVARQQPYDESADDGHDDDERAERVSVGREDLRGEALVEGEARDEGDEPHERVRDEGADAPDD